MRWVGIGLLVVLVLYWALGVAAVWFGPWLRRRIGTKRDDD